MHVHPFPMGTPAVSIYALYDENAAAAQHAAKVRNRLRRAAQSVEAGDGEDPDVTLLIGQWLGSRSEPSLSGDTYRAAAEDDSADLL